jgi:hypothetical protein
MIQAVRSAAVPAQTSRQTSFGATDAAAYAADWPGSTGQAPALRTDVAAALPAAANDTDLLTRAKQDALLSADVYKDAPNPPPGFHVASEAELTDLNLTSEMLERPGASSFRARVYVTGSGDAARYVVAFRGSQTGEDWRNNLEQGVGLDAPSYAKALRIGREIARSGAEVTFTGHSLGGGLASAASIASGREADTFNAAGLSPQTIGEARAIASANSRGVAAVQAYHVPGEILTVVQNGGDRAAGAIIGGMLAGIPGGIAGAIGADAPPAYGSPHTLPDVRPEGKSFLDGLNPIDRHKIDWVLAGTAALH